MIRAEGDDEQCGRVEWLVETIPADAGRIADFEIAFKSETLAGEEVLAASVEIDPGVRFGRAMSTSSVEHAVAACVLRDR